jgi:hypothetical protein
MNFQEAMRLHAQLVRQQRGGGRNKFGAKRTTDADGEVFHSTGEMRRYSHLQVLERGKLLRNLKRQVPFKLHVNGMTVCTYVADFTYDALIDDDTWGSVVEDFKSAPTARLPEYRLKKALMLAVYGITILETHQPKRKG